MWFPTDLGCTGKVFLEISRSSNFGDWATESSSCSRDSRIAGWHAWQRWLGNPRNPLTFFFLDGKRTWQWGIVQLAMFDSEEKDMRLMFFRKIPIRQLNLSRLTRNCTHVSRYEPFAEAANFNFSISWGLNSELISNGEPAWTAWSSAFLLVPCKVALSMLVYEANYMGFSINGDTPILDGL